MSHQTPVRRGRPHITSSVQAHETQKTIHSSNWMGTTNDGNCSDDTAQRNVTPRTAMISGHIDISEAKFLQHYRTALDSAITDGNSFVLANADGADALSLRYLLHHGVTPSRITIYLRAPPAARGKHKSRTACEDGDAEADVVQRYWEEGFMVRSIVGSYTERDAAMTRESDYDILWLRPEEETRILYGRKYRANRISGTQKNKERRAEQTTAASAVAVLVQNGNE